MDERIARQIQREGADALLDAGIVVPLKRFRLPWRKAPVELTVTMRRPYLSGQMAFARTYLALGVTSEEMWGFTKEEEMKFLASHGKELGLMVAETLCRGWWPGRCLWLRVVSWFVRHFVEQEMLMGVVRRYSELMGTDSFIGIISLAERTNPMKPRLGQSRKGSQGTRVPIAPSDSCGR